MSFSFCHQPYIDLILSFTGSYHCPDPSVKTNSREVKEKVIGISGFSLINRQCKNACQPKLLRLRQINDLINKYCYYNILYGFGHYGNQNPQLVDALFTGYLGKSCKSTFQLYTPEIEEDIKKIVNLMPQSLFCMIGMPNPKEPITPLVLACLNSYVPLHIIHFLLQKGANPYTLLPISDASMSSYEYLERNLKPLNPERFAAVTLLFQQNCENENTFLISAMANANLKLKSRKRKSEEFKKL